MPVGRYRCYLLSLSCEGVLAIYCCFGTFAQSSGAPELGGAGGGDTPHEQQEQQEQALVKIFVLVVFMGVGNAGSQTLLRSIQGDLFDEAEVRPCYLLLAPYATF